MLRDRIKKQISILIALTLIIGLMSAFVMSKNTKAEEQQTTTPQETTTEQETTEPTPVNPDEFEMVAHRGYSSVAPENSTYAFQAAANADFKHIELDLRRCKEKADGSADWVVCHDETLKRLCGVDKAVSSMTVSEIQKYHYISGNNIARYGNNVKIMSLADIISLVKQYKDQGIDWRFEIKELNNDEEQEQKVFDEIVQPLIDADVIDCVTFISFDASILNKILKEDERVKAWYLAKVMDEDHLSRAKNLKAKYDGRLEGVILKGTTYTTDETDVESLLNEDLKVGVYVLDSRVMMGAYYSMGVRSFTTNKVSPNSMSVSLMKHKYSKSDFTYKISKRSYTYTGTRKKPTITLSYEGEDLLEGLNYEISYSNNKYPGTGTVTATLIRNASGEKDKTFTISMPKVKEFKVAKNYATSVKYQWTPNTNITGYKVYRYNYSTKKYQLVKTIKKNKTKTFKATKLTTATKVRYRVKTYLTYKKKTYKSDPCKGKTTYTKPGKENSIKMNRSKKKKTIKVRFGKLPRVTGYTVRIATDKNFTRDVRIRTANSKTRSVKFKKLNKKRTYYAKVRGYLKVGKTYYYGAYSKVVCKKGKKAKKKKKE